MSVGTGLHVADEQVVRQELGLDTPAVNVSVAPDPALLKQAETAVGKLLAVDPENVAAARSAKSSVETMGANLQTEAAAASKMLEQPLHAMMKHGEEGGAVAKSLIDLKVQVEALDPAQFEFEQGWLLRLLGKLPGVGTPLKRYFSRYQTAGAVIDNIVLSLEKGRDQLKRDNITLADDQDRMRQLCLKLEQLIGLGRAIDAQLDKALSETIPRDDPRYTFLQQEVQYLLRQRIQDLQQQLLVSQQSVLTIEMIIRNNKELIRGVGRALDVTVNALRVAATLAIALANQKIVLDKIQAVTRTTETMLAQNAERLKTQGVAIHKQGAQTQLDLQVLEQCFEDIRQAMDEVSRFRMESLPKMASHIGQMAQMSAAQEAEIVKLEKAAAVRQGMSDEFVIDISE